MSKSEWVSSPEEALDAYNFTPESRVSLIALMRELSVSSDAPVNSFSETFGSHTFVFECALNPVLGMIWCVRDTEQNPVVVTHTDTFY